MAKHFIDTEFIEGFKKPLFGKRRHFIDLISIGIYCEDGRSYYAISNEYNYNDADEWVKKNVILPMYWDMPPFNKEHMEPSNFHKYTGKSNKQIMYDIVEFICPIGVASDFAGVGSLQSGLEGFLQVNPPEFYGYYADYDWVLFCSLFGRMIDLPKGFPMYCIDLKQVLDETAQKLDWLYGRDIWSNSNRSVSTIGKGQYQQKDRPATFDEKLKTLKELHEYPVQKNEHNASNDARWNFDLYKFLQSL